MSFDYSVPLVLDPYVIVGLALAIGAALLVVARRNPDPRGGTVWGLVSIALGFRNVLIRFIQDGTPELILPADIVNAMIVIGFGCALALHLRRRVALWHFLGGVSGLFTVVTVVRIYADPTRFQGLAALLFAAVMMAAGAAFLLVWRRQRTWEDAAAGLASLCSAAVTCVHYVTDAADHLLVVAILRAGVFLVIGIAMLSLLQRSQIDHLRRQIETRRSAEERFRDIAETASDWVWETDALHRVAYISSRVSQISGRDSSVYVGKTRAEQEGIVKDDALAEYERLMAVRQPYRDHTLRTVSPVTGKLHTYLLSGKPAFDAGGAFLGFRGTGRDVTHELESRAIMEAILGGVGNAVGGEYMHALVGHLAKALDGDVVFIGALDASRSQIEAFAIHSVDGSQRAAAYDPRGTPSGLVAGGEVCAFARGVTERFPMDGWLRAFGADGYVGVPLRDGHGATIGVLTLVRRRPITNVETITAVLRAHAVRVAAELDRQLADRSVRESEARFRSLIDNMPISFSISDRQGCYLVVNRTFEAWLGLASGDVVGKTYAELRGPLGFTDRHLEEMERDRALVWTDGIPRQHEQRRRFADGVERDLAVSIFPIRDAAGEPVALGIVATDVSALKQMERNLAEAQKAEALGRFASGIAHDFNNIVGAIAGFAQFVREDAPPESSFRHHAERILDASARAKGIIQQILTYSRRQGPQRELVDLPTLMQDTLGFVDTIASGSEIRVPPSWPEAALHVDPTQFMQVLMNLCSNAAHAMRGRPGAVEVSAGLVAPEERRPAGAEHAHPAGLEVEADGVVRLTAGTIAPRQDYVVVRVADQGVGMGREVLQRILDPFFTTKGKGEGTGLGIPVVHGIMLAHGGALSIRSKAGAFTSVELWFPAAYVDEVEESAADAADGRSKVRVLIVDDDVTFADMLATGLERLGYSAVVANDPEAGLDAFRKAPLLWDAVVTDQNMPRMTGLELVAWIKTLRPVVPCIVCSGNGDELSETVVRAAHADAYVRKPVDPTVLGKVIEGLLEIRRSSAA